MPLFDDLKADTSRIFAESWSTSQGRVVPDPSAVTLGNTAIEFDYATVLYADLDGSTKMVDEYKWQFSAEIYKAYLNCAAKIIKANGGVITAYDGDRIMAVFVGDRKNSSAAYAGLRITWAVRNIINPAIKAQYPSSDFTVRHVVGIDTSPIRAARIGVRGDNDLVWVGRAANYAAKLTTLSSDTPVWITGEVFDMLADPPKQWQGQAVWQKKLWVPMNNMPIYCSGWQFTLS
jgi:class 3 adenylate cyclase